MGAVEIQPTIDEMGTCWRFIFSGITMDHLLFKNFPNLVFVTFDQTTAPVFAMLNNSLMSTTYPAHKSHPKPEF